MLTKISINHVEGTRLVELCLVAARQQRIAISVAVVDDAGSLLHFARMDGARSHSIDLAMRKARAAAISGVSTKQIDAALKAGLLSNVESVGSGGVPVKLNDTCAGGVGVSGASAEIDHALAESAVTAIAGEFAGTSMGW